MLPFPHRCDVLGPLDEEDVACEDGEADGDEGAPIFGCGLLVEVWSDV